MAPSRIFPAIIVATLVLAGPASAADDAANAPVANPLLTNQAYIDRLMATRELDIENISEVFWFVFGSLPDEVRVYPTENYYYFEFLHAGAAYAGNIRLDVADRDQGTVHFAYFRPHRPWQSRDLTHYAPLGRDDGVEVEKLADLVYRIAYRGKQVTFHLNDLRDVKPPADALLSEERYLGPVFDESGTQLYFIYNRALKRFLYVLDESKIGPDALNPAPANPALEVDSRTGFVYLTDPIVPRRILVGVSDDNTDANNYFDGPFDQLPDNFMGAGTLRDVAVDAYPSLEGMLDIYGHFIDESIGGRILIDPYWGYQTLEDLDFLSACEEKQADPKAFYVCILPDD